MRNEQSSADGAFDSLAEFAFDIGAAANGIVNEAERAAKESAMRLSELLFLESTKKKIFEDYDSYIKKYAKDEFQRRIMRAIVLEEQVHEFPPFLEGALEQVGWGDSVGPSQIRVSKWAEKLRTNRDGLIKKDTHFRSMRKLLDEVEAKARESGLSRNTENIGSLWNNISARKPTDYGRRVKEFDNMLKSPSSPRKLSEEISGNKTMPQPHPLPPPIDPREIEKSARERKEKEEQRSKKSNYGPSARSHLPDGPSRNSGAPRPFDAGYMPTPLKGSRKDDKPKEKPKEDKPAAPAPSPHPNPPPPPKSPGRGGGPPSPSGHPTPSPKSKDDLPIEKGPPIRRT